MMNHKKISLGNASNDSATFMVKDIRLAQPRLMHGDKLRE